MEPACQQHAPFIDGASPEPGLRIRYFILCGICGERGVVEHEIDLCDIRWKGTYASMTYIDQRLKGEI